MSELATSMDQVGRMADAWPRLADGLFDVLADVEVPGETLADLDVAIRACRLLAEAGEVLWACRTGVIFHAYKLGEHFDGKVCPNCTRRTSSEKVRCGWYRVVRIDGEET